MMNRIATGLAIAALAAAAAPAAAGRFIVSLEAEGAGVQNSTSGFHSVAVENFNGRSTGEPQDFTTGFGGSAIFSGTYTGVGVNNADQYGGAGGAGQYANARTGRSYAVDLQSTEPTGVSYFGFWLSALDADNNVSFYQGGRKLFTFTAADARDFIDTLPNRNAYFGNPNAPYLGNNGGEPYAFLNFYARGQTRFDRIVFEQGNSGGYESDNHTVGRWSRISGKVLPISGAVPEPSTWALMIIGFGLVGVGQRRRKTVDNVAA